MPRYYKDKIFTQLERQIGGQAAQQRQEEEQEKIIKQLTEEHGDRQTAIMRYEEQIDYQYKMIRIKSKNSNSL